MCQQWLSKPEVKNLFVRAATELHVNIILDKIDNLSERHGYCIHCHDSYGPIPDIEVECIDDNEYVLDRISLALERLYVNLGF
jgi:hypothetical protein